MSNQPIPFPKGSDPAKTGSREAVHRPWPHSTPPKPHGDPLALHTETGRVLRGLVPIYRITLAIPDEPDTDVVTVIDYLRPTAILDANISFGFGIGAWGTERAVTIETATPKRDSVTRWVTLLCEQYGQHYAYVVVDGRNAYEVTHQGAWSRITGRPTTLDSVDGKGGAQ